jgi:polysaccharide export outer membrane protein
MKLKKENRESVSHVFRATREPRLCLALLACLSLSACINHHGLVNFNEGRAFPQQPEALGRIPDLTIQPDDQLSIRVRTLDMEAAEPYNLDPEMLRGGGLFGQGGGMGARALMGYLVDKDGYIDMPVLGRVKVAGLTTNQLRDQLRGMLENHLKDPVVIVRFFNFRITVLGEVGAPGAINLSNERVTILDALGQAGDVTVYGNRRRVLIYRQVDDQREYGYVNLHDRDVFNSPYFFLRQNDIIYVEPLQVRTATVRDQSQRLLPWISVITTVTTLAITLSRL